MYHQQGIPPLHVHGVSPQMFEMAMQKRAAMGLPLFQQQHLGFTPPSPGMLPPGHQMVHGMIVTPDGHIIDPVRGIRARVGNLLKVAELQRAENRHGVNTGSLVAFKHGGKKLLGRVHAVNHEHIHIMPREHTLNVHGFPVRVPIKLAHGSYRKVEDDNLAAYKKQQFEFMNKNHETTPTGSSHATNTSLKHGNRIAFKHGNKHVIGTVNRVKNGKIHLQERQPVTRVEKMNGGPEISIPGSEAIMLDMKHAHKRVNAGNLEHYLGPNKYSMLNGSSVVRGATSPGASGNYKPAKNHQVLFNRRNERGNPTREIGTINRVANGGVYLKEKATANKPHFYQLKGPNGRAVTMKMANGGTIFVPHGQYSHVPHGGNIYQKEPPPPNSSQPNHFLASYVLTGGEKEKLGEILQEFKQLIKLDSDIPQNVAIMKQFFVNNWVYISALRDYYTQRDKTSGIAKYFNKLNNQMMGKLKHEFFKEDSEKFTTFILEVKGAQHAKNGQQYVANKTYADLVTWLRHLGHKVTGGVFR